MYSGIENCNFEGGGFRKGGQRRFAVNAQGCEGGRSMAGFGGGERGGRGGCGGGGQGRGGQGGVCRWNRNEPAGLADKLIVCARMAQRGGCGRHRGQLGVLKLLSQSGGMGQRELQDMLGIQAGSMSEIAAKLERKGLIRRVTDESDGRRISLALTETGRLLAQAQENDIGGDIFSALTEEERKNLGALLDKLIDGNAPFGGQVLI